MATLILTTVGSAIGGPIGGAVGALLGQAVDRQVLRPRGRQGPRLTELKIQTSSYGTSVPAVFGTMRVGGTVIWATDLIETREKRNGGKGQPSTTMYNYAASFAVALSGRRVRSVGRIWAEGKLLRGAAGDWKVPVTFRLHPGDERQPPDPLIASAEGAGLAPAHRGIAYGVFEQLPLGTFGNRIPSLTFEVVGDDAPVPIGSIARDIADGVLSGPGPAVTLDGFVADGDGVRGVLETLAEASGAWFAPVGDGLEMRSAVAATVAVRDSGSVSGSGTARRMRRIAAIETVPVSVSIAHYDPARDHQTGVQRAVRPGAGRRADRIEMPAALSAGAAKTMAEAVLARAEAGRVRRRVSTDVSALHIAPGDGVTISDEHGVGEGGAWRVRGVSLEQMAIVLDLTPVAAGVVPTTASAGRVSAAPDVAIGTTIVHAFEMPALDDVLLSVPRLTIVAAGTAPGWRRAALSYSVDDGVSWIAAGGTAAPGVIGAVRAAAGPGSATLIDLTSLIEVELAHDAMVLTGAEALAIDRGANLALIGDELIQFADAVQIAPRRWRLSRLWRGRRATAATAHAIGERFVLLDSDSAVSLPVAIDVGRAVRVMASGAGDAGGAVETVAVVSGASVLPPAPVAPRVTRDAEGQAMLRWTRRSRLGWRWGDAADTPLAEEQERYRVTIAPSGGTARTIDIPVPKTELSSVDLAGAVVTIRQVGTNGDSPPCVLTI